MLATEMNGVTATQKFYLKRRHGDGFSLKFGERIPQPREIWGVGEDGEIGVAAKRTPVRP